MISSENTSRVELAQKAYELGAISYDEFERILEQNGVSTKSEENPQNSQQELIENAKQKGAITDDEYYKLLSNLENQPSLTAGKGESGKYERGTSSLDVSPQDIEKYNKRRKETTSKLPPSLQDLYGKYLYPEGEEMAQEAQSSAKGIRNIATLPGTLLDLPLMPANLTMGALGKETYVPSQMIGGAIDKATQGYTRPETNREKVQEAVTQTVGPMPVLKGIGASMASQGSKLINKPGKFIEASNALTPQNVLATGAGAAGAQQYLNSNPQGGMLGATGVGLLSSLAGNKAGKNIDLLHRPSAAMARMFHVNPNKVANQLVDTQTGKYIPSTLADISDSEGIKLAQHALGKTPFLGNIVKKARYSPLEAEKNNLNKIGFNNALNTEETGELALKGAKKHKEYIGNEVSRREKLIEEGLKPYASPYPSKKPSLEDLEKLERKKYNEQFLRKSKGINSEKDSVDYKKQLGKEAKQVEIIEHYTEKKANQLKNEPINLVPYSKTKKLIGNKFNQHDMTKSQLDEFNNKFGQLTEKLDDFAKEYKRKGIPYKSLDGIRKSVDDTVSTWGEVGNVTQGKLKQLRTTIQKDIRDYLESKNPELGKAWDEKNKIYTNYKKVHEPHITNITNLSEKGSMEDVTKSLLSNMKNAGRKIVTVSKGLNEKEKEKLGFSLMKELGKESIDGDFDLFTFGKNIKRVKSGGKKAFRDLFTPEQTQSIDRLGRRMKDIQEASSLATQSPTGYINKFYQTIRHPIKSIGGTVGSAAILGIYTNPKFLNWISKGAKINDQSKMAQHIGKLKTMNLGSNVLNQSVRSMYDRLEKKETEEK